MDDAKLKYYKSLGINTKTKAFKRYYNAGLLDNIDESYVKELKDFWRKNYGKEISPLLHIAFANLTGKKDVRVVPSKPQMWNEFIPFFNDMDIRVGYSDKNIYDKLVNTENTAKTFLKRVRGHYLNSENKLLDLNEVKLLLESLTEDVIIKPSNRDNGQGITKLKVKDGN